MFKKIRTALPIGYAMFAAMLLFQPFTIENAEAQCLRARVNKNNGNVVLRQVGSRPDGVCRRPHISVSDLVPTAALGLATPKPSISFGGAGVNTAFTTGSLNFIEVDSVEITIPEGEEYRILTLITAETVCRKLVGEVSENSWCAVQVMLNGQEMSPIAGGNRFAAIDHAPIDGISTQYRSHALQRFSDGALGAGTYFISFEVAVNQTDMELRVDDWAMLVKALPVDTEGTEE